MVAKLSNTFIGESLSSFGPQESEREKKARWEEPAPSFYCPLTRALMKEPVQDREGNSYEKDAIEKWLSENPSSPITRNRLRKKHLVPNRALKEAIEFEVSWQNKMNTRKPEERILLPKNEVTISDPADVLSASARRSTTHSEGINHHQAINDFLSSIDTKLQLDKFGMAFLPADKLLQLTRSNGGKKIRLLMVIDAPSTKDTFQLYTHFNGSIENCCSSPASDDATNENRVLSNLLVHGKHKALSLRQVSDDRMRFSFEGKKSEVSSEGKVKKILDMFVKVSIRMKKTIESSS